MYNCIISCFLTFLKVSPAFGLHASEKCDQVDIMMLTHFNG